MYIPPGASEAASLTPAPRAPTYGRIQGESLLASNSDAFDLAAGLLVKLAKRQFSSDPVQNTNTSIGIAVGIVLGIFLIGTFAFLWVYRYSIRCTSRKKRRSGSRRSSKGSKASSDNGGEAAPAAEEAPASQEAEAAPAEEA